MSYHLDMDIRFQFVERIDALLHQCSLKIVEVKVLKLSNNKSLSF